MSIALRTTFIKVLLEALERVCPLKYADRTWDNVGLILESPNSTNPSILVCNDLSTAVLDEAVERGVAAIISYHPPWFRAEKQMVLGGPLGLLAHAAFHSISIFSPHTALDAVPGGINDWLIEPFAKVSLPIQPCLDCPEGGYGRIARENEPIPLDTAVVIIKERLGLQHVRVARAKNSLIRSVAVCAGSGGSLLTPNLAVDLVITGELSHHSVLSLLASNCNVILTEHSNSERPYLQTVFIDNLKKELPKMVIKYSESDSSDPLQIL